jgi:hypothetical protein
MKRIVLVLACIVLVMCSVGSAVAQQHRLVYLPIATHKADEYAAWRSLIVAMDGNAWIYAATGYEAGGYTYAGMITSEVTQSNSLINPYGPYGDPASDYSIRNPASMWGSPDGPYSAMNPEATDPPIICWVDWAYEGVYQMRLTTNPTFPHRIDTIYLLAELERRATRGQRPASEP